MFEGATSFNQPLAEWNVSSVTDMSYMFDGATSFNQPLADWNVLTATDLRFIFRETDCPVAEGENSCFVEFSASPSSSPSASPSPSAALSAEPSAGPSSSASPSASRSAGPSAGPSFSASPTASTGEVQVQINHDQYPGETGWTLRDSTGTLISGQAVGSFTTQNSTVTSTSSVALGMYTFEMTDTEGDGICCEYGSGSFSIAVNGETVVSNDGQFGDIVQETFEVRAPTP
jgi:surface protein